MNVPCDSDGKSRAAQAMTRIACIGECMIELIEGGATAPGAMRRGYGGDTLNSAVYMARELPGADARVSYVTLLGDDIVDQPTIGSNYQLMAFADGFGTMTPLSDAEFTAVCEAFELHEVADGRGDDVALVLEVFPRLVFFEAGHALGPGEDLAELGGDARLFRNDQSFAHAVSSDCGCGTFPSLRRPVRPG